MKVELISATQPYIKTEDNSRYLDIEEFIVYCARVSNPSNQLNTLTVPNLIKYCIKHEHWSIFEQAYLTFMIQTSRDISAQIIRHRSFSFQEFSLRYSATNALESFDIRKQAQNNRQSSSDLLDLSKDDVDVLVNYLKSGLELYNNLLEKGAAKECARKILPLCTQTTLYMSGSLRSWIHYVNLRSKEDTQLEHREIALSIKKILSNLFPNISLALSWTGEVYESPSDSEDILVAKTWGPRSLSEKQKTDLEKEKEKLQKEFAKKHFIL